MQAKWWQGQSNDLSVILITVWFRHICKTAWAECQRSGLAKRQISQFRYESCNLNTWHHILRIAVEKAVERWGYGKNIRHIFICQWQTTDRATWSNISRDLAKHSGVYITRVHGNWILCPLLASVFLLHNTQAAKMDWREKAPWKFPSTPPVRRPGSLPLHIELCGMIFTLYPRPKSSLSPPLFAFILLQSVWSEFFSLQGQGKPWLLLKDKQDRCFRHSLPNLRCFNWSLAV